MAKQRNIDTKFWTDNYVVNLKGIEKFLFLYILTNPFTNILGIYEISIRQIIFDTRMSAKRIRKTLDDFERDKKIRFRDGWITIKNFTRHQKDNPKINTGMGKLIKGVPNACIEWANIDWNRLSIECDSLSHLNTNTNTNINFNYNKGKFDGIPNEYLKELEKTYPGVDVSNEIDKMTNWLMDNPKKKRQGKRTFINNWLKKANDNSKEGEESGVPRLRQGDYSGV